MPHARIAVMGSGGGREFVFKDEIRALEETFRKSLAGGTPEADAKRARDVALLRINERYERELMNPKEALSLGSVSRIVMPGTSRRVLGEHLAFLMRTYKPSPMGGVQRESE
jgi:acetyl-CoA carboxylase carboxyltransferase component